MNIDAIVLAAGESCLAVHYLGKTSFVGHILEVLGTPPFRKVVLVVGGDYFHDVPDGDVELTVDAKALPSLDLQKVEVVYTPHDGGPALRSLQLGLQQVPADSDAVLVWPVDHPLVLPSTVYALVDSFCESPAAVVQPCTGDKPGHPVLFSAALYQDLTKADVAAGARAVVQAHADERRLIAVSDWHIHTDLDKPGEYEKWVESPGQWKEPNYWWERKQAF